MRYIILNFVYADGYESGPVLLSAEAQLASFQWLVETGADGVVSIEIVGTC